MILELTEKTSDFDFKTFYTLCISQNFETVFEKSLAEVNVHVLDQVLNVYDLQLEYLCPKKTEWDDLYTTLIEMYEKDLYLGLIWNQNHYQVLAKFGENFVLYDPDYDYPIRHTYRELIEYISEPSVRFFFIHEGINEEYLLGCYIDEEDEELLFGGGRRRGDERKDKRRKKLPGVPPAKKIGNKRYNRRSTRSSSVVEDLDAEEIVRLSERLPTSEYQKPSRSKRRLDSDSESDDCEEKQTRQKSPPRKKPKLQKKENDVHDNSRIESEDTTQPKQVLRRSQRLKKTKKTDDILTPEEEDSWTEPENEESWSDEEERDSLEDISVVELPKKRLNKESNSNEEEFPNSEGNLSGINHCFVFMFEIFLTFTTLKHHSLLEVSRIRRSSRNIVKKRVENMETEKS